MNKLGNLKSSDLELLSAYVDGECSKRQTERIESRLHAEPAFRRAFEELRATAGLFRSLPEVQPPRSFALTPEMIGSRRKQPYPILQLATALASFVFVVLVGLDALTAGLVPVLGSTAPGVTAVEQPAMAPEMALAPAEDVGESNAEVEPEIEMEVPRGGGLPEPTAQLPAAPFEGIEPTEGFFDQEGIEGDATSKFSVKGKSVEEPGWIHDDEIPVPTHSIDAEPSDQPDPVPDRPSGILTWPVWLIALRGAEIVLGGAIIILVALLIQARRK